MIADVLNDLERMGYVDDSRFAKTKALSAAQHKHHGKRRAQIELMKAGVDRTTASDRLQDYMDRTKVTFSLSFLGFQYTAVHFLFSEHVRHVEASLRDHKIAMEGDVDELPDESGRRVAVDLLDTYGLVLFFLLLRFHSVTGSIVAINLMIVIAGSVHRTETTLETVLIIVMEE